jgi:hypothetical protein
MILKRISDKGDVKLCTRFNLFRIGSDVRLLKKGFQKVMNFLTS